MYLIIVNLSIIERPERYFLTLVKPWTINHTHVDHNNSRSLKYLFDMIMITIKSTTEWHTYAIQERPGQAKGAVAAAEIWSVPFKTLPTIKRKLELFESSGNAAPLNILTFTVYGSFLCCPRSLLLGTYQRYSQPSPRNIINVNCVRDACSTSG